MANFVYICAHCGDETHLSERGGNLDHEPGCPQTDVLVRSDSGKLSDRWYRLGQLNRPNAGN